MKDSKAKILPIQGYKGPPIPNTPKKLTEFSGFSAVDIVISRIRSMTFLLSRTREGNNFTSLQECATFLSKAVTEVNSVNQMIDSLSNYNQTDQKTFEELPQLREFILEVHAFKKWVKQAHLEMQEKTAVDALKVRFDYSIEGLTYNIPEDLQ